MDPYKQRDSACNAADRKKMGITFRHQQKRGTHDR